MIIIFILFVKLNNIKRFLWVGKNSLKYQNNLMHCFDVILLSDVISSIGHTITDCGTIIVTHLRGLQCRAFGSQAIMDSFW